MYLFPDKIMMEFSITNFISLQNIFIMNNKKLIKSLLTSLDIKDVNTKNTIIKLLDEKNNSKLPNSTVAAKILYKNEIFNRIYILLNNNI